MTAAMTPRHTMQIIATLEDGTAVVLATMPDEALPDDITALICRDWLYQSGRDDVATVSIVRTPAPAAESATTQTAAPAATNRNPALTLALAMLLAAAVLPAAGVYVACVKAEDASDVLMALCPTFGAYGFLAAFLTTAALSHRPERAARGPAIITIAVQTDCHAVEPAVQTIAPALPAARWERCHDAIAATFLTCYYAALALPLLAGVGYAAWCALPALLTLAAMLLPFWAYAVAAVGMAVLVGVGVADLGGYRARDARMAAARAALPTLSAADAAAVHPLHSEKTARPAATDTADPRPVLRQRRIALRRQLACCRADYARLYVAV